jgi:transglutaminase-like putative cysteine protease
MVVGYDRLHKVNSIEGTLYDASGNQLKKVKGKEIEDLSATRESLYDDNRVKVHDFRYRGFPYTVEYEVEVEFNHTFYFPDWEPQSDEHLAVEKSSYTFAMPANYNLRYKAFHYTKQPVVTTEKDKKIMKWEVSNLPAITKPYASPSWNELSPTVLFAPSEFQMEGYKGDASSWLSFGNFVSSLFQGRDKLPDAVVQKITSLTAGITNPKEKVAKLYEYLQQNTRYISIQLGIGGFQPFEASYVAQKGYGDCKALSNYMYSLLKAAGIKSYPALIHAGSGVDAKNLIEDLPSTQFNHVVLFVPFEKDTMWLECTSQDESPGYAGSFTGNRKALALTEEGGKLVSTPRYTTATNLQTRSVQGKIDEEGNLEVTVATKYAAMQQDYYSGMISALSKEKVKKLLNERLDLSTYEITDFAYRSKKDRLPEVSENLKIAVANYATVSGRRLFIVPNVMNRSTTHNINIAEERTCDYVFDMPYTDIDSVEIEIPSGYQIEAMMPETTLKTSYGTYVSNVKLEGSKIIYYRKMERFAGRYPAKEGEQIAKFYNDIYKADRSKMVLVKKE